MDMLMDFREDKKVEALSQIDAVEACFQEWVNAIEGN